MAGAIILASLLCVALGVARLVRRRRGAFSALDHISVSRQWLMQHQADDRS